MKDLLIYVAKNLVEFPDEVRVEETENDKGTLLELHVTKTDVGRVIGKHGRVAKEIRTLVKAMDRRSGRKVTIEISE